ncbi:hypothetical protein [Anoxybacteroides tepidamans]|uniref:hypothetical protein n=1 Tax=Anoxybacteroides tepidamans TaxID=265948 RepID=UPI000486EDE0|nr:hypothetical protein [Anoxybacillus tepidamans]
MGQLNMFYHFDIEQDLMYKATGFVQLLNRMSEWDGELVQLVHHEMQYGRGQIVDRTNEAIEQYQKMNQSHHELHKNFMNTAALRYTNMINDMRGQYITLYYDVIVRNKNKD